MREAALAGALFALVVIFAAAAHAQRPAADIDAVRQFTAATREYVWLHRRIERDLGPVEVTANAASLEHAIVKIAAAIREARPEARQGDFFTPALMPYLRGRIAEVLRENDFTPDDVRRAERADGIDPGLVSLRVNGPFPWILGAAMFPCVLHALPELPPELQYRIVGDDLVLIDVHASLILDIMPSALGWETER